MVLLLCMTPSRAQDGHARAEHGPDHPEYGLIDHCVPLSAFYDFEVWQRADTIIVAHVSDDAEFSEEKWYEAEFRIEDVLLGDLKKGAKVTLFADIGGKISRESLEEVSRRAALHESPKFLPIYLTRFPVFGYASTGPEPDAECYPVPVVLKNVSYVIVRAGRSVLSIEPVFRPSDYWLRFLRTLKGIHYWQRRAMRDNDAGDEDQDAASR